MLTNWWAPKFCKWQSHTDTNTWRNVTMSHATNYGLLTFQFRSWFARNSFQINCVRFGNRSNRTIEHCECTGCLTTTASTATHVLVYRLHPRTRRKCCKTFTIQKRNNQDKTKRNENNDWQPELPLNKIVFALFCSNIQWNQRNNKIKIDADTHKTNHEWWANKMDSNLKIVRSTWEAGRCVCVCVCMRLWPLGSAWMNFRVWSQMR